MGFHGLLREQLYFLYTYDSGHHGEVRVMRHNALQIVGSQRTFRKNVSSHYSVFDE
jgi:hypothetical protein